MEEEMTIQQFIWRASCQLGINEHDDREPLEPRWWGSGFFLLRNDLLYFVTADHCIHPDDYSPIGDGRNGKEYLRHVITNRNVDGQLSSHILPLYDFYYFDRPDKDFSEIIDKLDVAITKVKSSVLSKLYTTNWVDPHSGKDIEKAGMTRVPIDANRIAHPNSEDEYIVCGCIHNDSDGVKAYRESIEYCGLKYVETSDNEYVLSTPIEDMTHRDWESLSGSPVFNYNGEILGMLIREVSEHHQLRVIPMNRIISCVEDVENDFEKEPFEIRNL